MRRILLCVSTFLGLWFIAAAEELVRSEKHDKDSDGASMMMKWNDPAACFIYPDSQGLRRAFDKGLKHGVTFWVYCETPQDGVLRCSIEGLGGEICGFDFHLGFTGWRAAWVKFEDMHAPSGEFYIKSHKDFPMCFVFKPSSAAGECWVDRFSFPDKDIHFQVSPDAQIPDNNSHIGNRRFLWHWARLWEWEQYPVLEGMKCSQRDKQDMGMLRNALQKHFVKSIPASEKMEQFIRTTEKQYDELIHKPIVSNNELKSSDSSLQKMIDLGWRYCCIYYRCGDKQALERFFKVFDHLIDEGFAWGSGMGTNNHYGYQIRNFAPSMLLMEKEIRNHGRADVYFKVLEYWSGEAECRVPYDIDRDEIVDCWNTLNLARLTSALLHSTDELKLAHLRAVTGWIQDSMLFTPGTVGGIKTDGTVFHHGGHYPSYWEGGLSSLGLFFSLVKGTSFVPDMRARNTVKKAAMALAAYTNSGEWGVGISGRHPEKTTCTKSAIEAIKSLAELGDLTNQGLSVDPELMNAYRRMSSGKNSITGFYSFNYGAFGIWHTRGWMMTLKSMNTYTWGSEIYASANRFGRYNSYGSLQLIGPMAASIHEEGWDWNSLPGVTSVHLPYSELNSPASGSLLVRGSERFGGVAQYGDNVGAMAFRYTEPDRINFVKGAMSTKSAFCFPDYAVVVGSGISNNSSCLTRTTLFQDFLGDNEVCTEVNEWKDGRIVTRDLYNNVYIMAPGSQVTVGARTNVSPDNTNKKSGTGRFLIGWIEHGSAPQNAKCEYMIAVQPTNKEFSTYKRAKPYELRELSDFRHVVYDIHSGIEATVDYKNEVIYFKQMMPDGSLNLSVGCPDLGIESMEYTTLDPGHPVKRTVTVCGTWRLAKEYDGVEIAVNGELTSVTVECADGASRLITLIQ